MISTCFDLITVQPEQKISKTFILMAMIILRFFFCASLIWDETFIVLISTVQLDRQDFL